MPKRENVGNMVILIRIDVNEWDTNEEDDWRYDDFEVYKAYMHKWVTGMVGILRMKEQSPILRPVWRKKSKMD